MFCLNPAHGSIRPSVWFDQTQRMDRAPLTTASRGREHFLCATLSQNNAPHPPTRRLIGPRGRAPTEITPQTSKGVEIDPYSHWGTYWVGHINSPAVSTAADFARRVPTEYEAHNHLTVDALHPISPFDLLSALNRLKTLTSAVLSLTGSTSQT